MVIRDVDFSHLIYFEKIHFLLLFEMAISRCGHPYKLDDSCLNHRHNIVLGEHKLQKLFLWRTSCDISFFKSLFKFFFQVFSGLTCKQKCEPSCIFSDLI